MLQHRTIPLTTLISVPGIISNAEVCCASVLQCSAKVHHKYIKSAPQSTSTKCWCDYSCAPQYDQVLHRAPQVQYDQVLWCTSAPRAQCDQQTSFATAPPAVPQPRGGCRSWCTWVSVPSIPELCSLVHFDQALHKYVEIYETAQWIYHIVNQINHNWC